MFKFIHAADLHLDSPLRGLEKYEGAPVDAIRGATREAMRNLVRLAVDEEVKFVLLAGDLYDGDWKDYNTGLFLAAQMSRLREASIAVFAISGNHDAASQITRALRMPDNVRILSHRKAETVVLEDLGVTLHGRSFPQRAVTDDLSASYPAAIGGYFNIGLLHTSANGREGHEPYSPCSLGGLVSKNYDYWALGHVHSREVLHENPWIVFPGNTQGRHIRETGPKGCTLVTVEDGHCASVEHRDLHTVEWAVCEIDAANALTPEEAITLVYARIQRLCEQARGRMIAVRVVIRGASEAHAELSNAAGRWTNEIRAAATDASGGSAWIEKVRFETSSRRVIDASGEFVRSLQEISRGHEALASFKEELASLRIKLPAELFEGPEAVIFNEADSLANARDILARRLLAGGLGL